MFRAHYSTLDRAVHRLAFRSVGWQKILSDLEDDIYSRQLRKVEIHKPVFVTSLPRAGTTLLLNLLSELPGFATHTYRNMPLVLCPLFWDTFSRPFRKEATLTERTHGDGMEVSYDSPEAFEEVVWKAFWPNKYCSEHIDIWTKEDVLEEFEEFFRQHILKIIFLGTKQPNSSPRYVSKNNANIARIRVIGRLFPDSRIIVPFRNPIDHIASLLRQHQNFLKIHSEDAFTAEYMASIGHFDFGATLKPINFNGWFPKAHAQDPQTAGFWMQYWIAAFEYLISQRVHNVVFVDYDKLCHNPNVGVRCLLEAIGFHDSAQSATLSEWIHAPTKYPNDRLDVSASLMQQAWKIHESLSKQALNGGG